MKKRVELFVMHGCSVCPQMERLFSQMLEHDEIDELKIYDVHQHTDLAEQYGIRSVPFYRINEVAFNGLKTAGEIRKILSSDLSGKVKIQIVEYLKHGELEQCEKLVLDNTEAQQTLFKLLMDPQTELTVRIGLSAIVETLAGQGKLAQYEQQLLEMSQLDDERLVIDALYFLSLAATDQSLQRLQQVHQHGASAQLRDQARELIEEMQP